MQGCALFPSGTEPIKYTQQMEEFMSAADILLIVVVGGIIFAALYATNKIKKPK